MSGTKRKSVSSPPGDRPSKLAKTITLREKTKDADFLVGPVKTLEWTEWTLAIYQVHHGDKANPDYKLCRHKGLERTGHKRVLFEKDTCNPVIFEVGVKFPEEDENVEIHAVYFKDCLSDTYRSRYLEPLEIIKIGTVRNEMLKLVTNKSKIYFRRATGSKKDILKALKRMQKYDYAWGWGGKRNNTHRKIEK